MRTDDSIVSTDNARLSILFLMEARFSNRARLSAAKAWPGGRNRHGQIACSGPWLAQ
jgi:hypothetical protein